MSRVNKKTKFCIGMLLCGVSGIALMNHYAQEQAQEFNQTKIVIGKDTISKQDFYANLEYTEKGWVYTNQEGKKQNIDSLTNSQYLEAKKTEVFHKLKLKNQVDTIYTSYGWDEKTNKKTIVYREANGDTLPSMPSMGYYNYDKIIVREFVADNPKLQKIMDPYSNSYNATYDHEYKHFKNAQDGIRYWNSYPIKFTECCLDEVATNIEQCLKQRDNYLEYQNLSYITPRFSFYKEALKAGKIKPSKETLSEKEQEVIANGVFDAWMKEKFNIYMNRENKRAICLLNDASYPAIKEDKEKHNKVMQKIFTIKGYDFWKHIAKREKEISDKITPEMREEWKKLEKEKFKNMDYLAKLELKKQQDGEEEYRKALSQNMIKARLISTFGKDR